MSSSRETPHLEDWEEALIAGDVGGHAPLKMTEPEPVRYWITLHALAIALGKTKRTVQRYCERGLIPGAYRTRGGHWRIRNGSVSRKSLQARLAKVKTRRSKRWSASVEAKARQRDKLVEQLAISHAHIDGTGRVRAKDLTQARVTEAAARERKPSGRQMALVIAVQELRAYHDAAKPTGRKLAEALGISLRTFRRRYSFSDVQAARDVAWAREAVATDSALPDASESRVSASDIATGFSAPSRKLLSTPEELEHEKTITAWLATLSPDERRAAENALRALRP